MEENFNYRILDELLERFGSEESSLIPILQHTQEHFRYLPAEIFPYLSKKIGISEAKIYGVATFYENFSLDKKGTYVIKVCDGTACHVRKSTAVLDALRGELGLSETKKTTDDFLFTVETVSCLGACGMAPTMLINDKVYLSLTPEKAVALIREIKENHK